MPDIIKDDGFQIPTKPARNALTSAEKMLEWIDSNKDEAKAVASHLIGLTKQLDFEDVSALGTQLVQSLGH